MDLLSLLESMEQTLSILEMNNDKCYINGDKLHGHYPSSDDD
jgi:hypothetical protein